MLGEIYHIGTNRYLNLKGRGDLHEKVAIQLSLIDDVFDKARYLYTHHSNQVSNALRFGKIAKKVNDNITMAKNKMKSPMNVIKFWGKDNPINYLDEAEKALTQKNIEIHKRVPVDPVNNPGVFKEVKFNTNFQGLVDESIGNSLDWIQRKTMKNVHRQIDDLLAKGKSLKEIRDSGVIELPESALINYDKFIKEVVPERFKEALPSKMEAQKIVKEILPHKNKEELLDTLYKVKKGEGRQPYEQVYKYTPTSPTLIEKSYKEPIFPLPNTFPSGGETLELDLKRMLDVKEGNKTEILNSVAAAAKKYDAQTEPRTILNNLHDLLEKAVTEDGRLTTHKLGNPEDIATLFTGAYIKSKGAPSDIQGLMRQSENIKTEALRILEQKGESNKHKILSHVMDSVQKDIDAAERFGDFDNIIKQRRFTPQEESNLLNTLDVNTIRQLKRDVYNKRLGLLAGAGAVAGGVPAAGYAYMKSKEEPQRETLIGRGKQSKRLFQEGVRK